MRKGRLIFGIVLLLIGIFFFITTPKALMSQCIVFELEPYVKLFKIRYSDGIPIVENKSSEIFEKVQNTGKDIIISTNKSPKNCSFFENSKIKWMYCVPKYPCELNDLDFTNFEDFDGSEVVEDGTSATLAAPGTDDDTEGQPDTRIEELERHTAELRKMIPKAV